MYQDRIPRTTLEQWKTLDAIVAHGSFAQAAVALSRSQSSISYAVSRLQTQMNVALLEMEGRRAKLTKEGEVLLGAAREMLMDAYRLEQLAVHLDAGWESEIRLVVDLAFPTRALLNALKAFADFAPNTRVQLKEVVLSGADEAIYDGSADLVIGSNLPKGTLGDRLIEVTFIAVAHPDHRLFSLNRQLTTDDLVREVHVVLRDSGQASPRDEGWLGSQQRWTVGSMATSLAMVSDGLGFAWLPEHIVAADLAAGRLARLPLAQGQMRCVSLFSIYPPDIPPGPATRELTRLIQQACGERKST